MSFGPPVEMLAGAAQTNPANQLADNPVWWPAKQTNGGQSNQLDLLGKRNSLARSTLPLAGQPNGLASQANLWAVLAPPYNPAHDITAAALAASVAAQADDPLQGCQNACFGSYKRNRRLPHIEAQFTITPPGLVGRGSAGPGAQHSLESPGVRDETDALQRGQLFVRELELPTLSGGGGGGQENWAPPRPPLPPGLPQRGQRTEALRMRISADSLEPAPVLGEMKAREKIETYLQSSVQPKQEEEEEEVEEEEELASSSPVHIEQVEELTFQPYYNMPALRYSIQLPLRKSTDGRLMLHGTSRLRPRRRRSGGSRPVARRAAAATNGASKTLTNNQTNPNNNLSNSNATSETIDRNSTDDHYEFDQRIEVSPNGNLYDLVQEN